MRDSVKKGVWGRRVLNTMIATLAVGCVILWPGCASKPFEQSEPFSRDRIGAVRRSVELTVATMESAIETTMTAVDRSQALCEDPGDSLDVAYSTARGDLSAAVGRQRSLTRRIEVTQTGGEAMFEEWRTELREYSDKSVEQASRESLERLETSHGAVINALEDVRNEILPLQESVNDRVLYLKHSRNEGPLSAVPARTPTMQARLAEVGRRAEVVRQAAAAFERVTSDR